MNDMIDINIRLTRLDCAACALRIDRALAELHGVQSASTNYAAAEASVQYEETLTDISQIASAIRKAGCDTPMDQVELIFSGLSPEKAETLRGVLLNVFGVSDAAVDLETGIASVRMWAIGVEESTLLSACRDAGFSVESGKVNRGQADTAPGQITLLRKTFLALFLGLPLLWDLPAWVRLVFVTLLVIGPGRLFLRSAWVEVKNRLWDCDILIAGCVLLIYSGCVWSLIATANGSRKAFLCGGLIVFLPLLIRSLEATLLIRAEAPLGKLHMLLPKTASVERGPETREIPVSALQAQDIIILQPGERIPVDGVLLEGTCTVDESAVSGDSDLKEKHPGDPLFGGSLNRAGSGKLRPLGGIEASALGERIQELQDQADKKRSVYKRVSSLGLILLCLSVTTFAFWPK